MRTAAQMRHVILGFLLSLAFVGNTHSAEVTRAGAPCDLAFTGPVAWGDKEKLEAAVSAVKKAKRETDSIVVCLRSEGGVYSEALRIVEYAIANGVGTYVVAEAECYSACAIIFMGGTRIENADEEDGVVFSRVLHVRGKLGFHAPYLKSGAVNTDDAATVFAEGVGAVAQLVRLKVMDSQLLVEMLLKGPNEIFMIDTIDKAGRWNFELAGYKEHSVISDQMLYTTCNNLLGWELNEYSYFRRNFGNRCDKIDGTSLGNICAKKQIRRQGGKQAGVRYEYMVNAYLSRTCVVEVTGNPPKAIFYAFSDSFGDKVEPYIPLAAWKSLPPNTPLRDLSNSIK